MTDETSAQRVRELLTYAPETGEFRWARSAGGVRAGSLAGWLNNDGYRLIRIDGQKYRAHRLAWLLVYGAFPTLEIDHKNRVRDDNRIENLREATETQNNANSEAKLGAAGYRGVYVSKSRQKYHARISVGGKTVHLGCFALVEKAAQVAAAARNEHFGEFAA